MSRAEEAKVTFLAPDCLDCGSPVMAARNPFYGVGMAVSEYVRNCVECPWYEFASDPGAVRIENPASKRGTVLQEFLTRVNTAVTILKPV